jgi:CubicO group peptidase (beta-lactamase class C family)
MAAALLTFAAGAARIAASQVAVDGFDDYVTAAMREWKVPGLAVAVVEDDRVVLARGYGVREHGKADRVDEHTVFAIGSSTKAFTAAAIGTLVDAGVVDLDSPVIRYLPGFLLFDPYVTREVTVRDLLTHRTGVAGGDLLWASGALSRDEIVHRLRFIPPTWSLRARFDYSNVMFIAAGQVLAAATGKTYDAVIRERILEPLGMAAATTSVRDLPPGGNVASPHEPSARGPLPVRWRVMDNTVAGGGINASVRDMAQWLRLNLANGVLDGRRVVSEAYMREMRTPQTLIRREGFWADMTPAAHFMTYGLGWILSDYHGRQLVQHGGGIDGMSAMVGLLPEANVGIVVLSNLNGNQLPAALMLRVFDAYLGVPPTDWSQRALDAARTAGRVAQTAPRPAVGSGVDGRPSLELQAYVGTYRHDAWGDAVVTLENGRLVLRYGTEFEGELEHVRFDRFRARWKNPARGTSQVNFTLDIDRRPARLDIYFWMVGEFRRVDDAAAR